MEHLSLLSPLNPNLNPWDKNFNKYFSSINHPIGSIMCNTILKNKYDDEKSLKFLQAGNFRTKDRKKLNEKFDCSKKREF